ncbi:MAG: tetratricopeptide repeat protein [Oceanospirillaceae bacterium]|nr:tetratricopeptide repeat protein [Oceanospirillaceae bacterium]
MLQPNEKAFIYNPANQSEAQLIDAFVIRGKEFGKIRRELLAADLKCNAQHFLIEGQRGTGKTSLLLRVGYEINSNPALHHLIAVQFAEEQYGIFDLCRLWEKTAEILEESSGFAGLSEALESHSEEDNYAIECFDIIERRLIAQDKRLVLLLDNVGDIFDKLSDIEQKRLRDIFHNSTHLQLIAASAKTLEFTYRHDQPFFEFFQTIKLQGLDQTEVRSLLAQLAIGAPDKVKVIIEQQPQRIEVIRRLTGGIPRTIVLLFEILVDDSANVFEDLAHILDRVTPLYKHRMDDLPKQQQAIMDALALYWDAVGAKEIVNSLQKRGFNTKKVAAQLILLEKNGLVESRLVDKKNKIYQLQERFFNIWYLMRYGRKKDKTQILWLVSFLKAWCTPEDLINRSKLHIQSAKNHKLSARGGYHMAEALAELVDDTGMQHKILQATRASLQAEHPELAEQLSRSDRELMALADEKFAEGDFEAAIVPLQVLVGKGYVNALNNIGLLYINQQDTQQAIDCYQQAIAKGHVSALFNLAHLYANQKDYSQAIDYYQQAIAKGHVSALNNLATLYANQKDYPQAIDYYQQAIAKSDVEALHNLAKLYAEQKDYPQAIDYLQQVIATGDVNALNNLANLYADQKQYPQAIDYYKQAIAKGDVEALNNLAILYDNQKDYPQAIDYYKQAIAKGDVNALNNLAILYADQKDYPQAIDCYQQVIAKGDINTSSAAMNELAWLYYQLYSEPEQSLNLIKRSVELKAGMDNTHSLAIILLWQGEYRQSVTAFKVALNEFFILEYTEKVIEYFILLLAQQQYHLALELMTEFAELKGRYKPLYFTLMHLLKDQYPKENLKMGSELTETVDEILQKVADKKATLALS